MVTSHPDGRKAVFLDRDGIINESLVRDGKPCSPRVLRDFHIYPESIEACQLLFSAGFLAIVVTNQPDIGRGLMEPSELNAMHQELLEKIPGCEIEVCCSPGNEHPVCPSRKPGTGMLLRAAERLGIQLHQSFMVGDRWRDIDCGAAAGCRTVFIERGYDETLKASPDHVCEGLLSAVRWIISQP